MQLDPVTTWAIIVVFVIPAGIGWATILGWVHARLDRLDREEPLYVEPRTVERLGGDRRG